MSGVPPGQHDYSSMRLSRHALERFVERFSAEPEQAANDLRRVLSRTRRLGRNPENGAIAVLAIHGDRALVAILQQATCLTVLTWNQFVPRLGRVWPNESPAQVGTAASPAFQRCMNSMMCYARDVDRRSSESVENIPLRAHSSRALFTSLELGSAPRSGWGSIWGRTRGSPGRGRARARSGYWRRTPWCRRGDRRRAGS